MAYFWPLTTATENIAFVSICSVSVAILCAIFGYLYLKYSFNKELTKLNSSVAATAAAQSAASSENASGDATADEKPNSSGKI